MMLQTSAATDKKEADSVFYALPASAASLPETATPLYEWLHQDGKQRRYGIDSEQQFPGFQRQKQPLCYVWKK
jgi:hypothetical protein